MALVDIVNENVHPYYINFKGDKITIPPGGSYAIDEAEAPQFLGQKPALKYDGADNQMPESYSMLKVVRRDSRAETPDVAVDKFVCHMDGKVFHSKVELDEYVASNYLDQLEDKKVAEAIKTRKPLWPKGEKT